MNKISSLLLCFSLIITMLSVPTLANDVVGCQSETNAENIIASAPQTENDTLPVAENKAAEITGGCEMTTCGNIAHIGNIDGADNDRLFESYLLKNKGKKEIKLTTGTPVNASTSASYSKYTRENDFSKSGEERVKLYYDCFVQLANDVVNGVADPDYGILALVDVCLDDELYGDRVWTLEELGLTSGATLEDVGNAGRAKLNNFMQVESEDFSLALNAVLSDCPEKLYWFDKTVGCYGMFYNDVDDPTVEYVYQYDTNGFYISDIVHVRFQIFMQASSDYQSGLYSNIGKDKNGDDILVFIGVDNTKITAANTAIANAQTIVDKYKNSTDMEKLSGYEKEICKLVKYNDSASNGNTSYGDPWQIVYVFDGDTTTDVVCEGYSKAFQYLCELTDFTDKTIACYSVTGDLDATGTSSSGTKTASGNHMWNIVTMNGKNYLVDITNDDKGMNTHNQLFMVLPKSGDLESGYIFNRYSQTFSYTYDEKTCKVFTENELLLYNVADTDCDEKIDLLDVLALLCADKNDANYRNDVNRDGKVDNDDANVIANYLVGIISAF